MKRLTAPNARLIDAILPSMLAKCLALIQGACPAHTIIHVLWNALILDCCDVGLWELDMA